MEKGEFWSIGIERYCENNFQRVYFSQCLAKPAAGRDELMFFGHFGGIEAIYFSF
jgi:hypothetical protein